MKARELAQHMQAARRVSLLAAGLHHPKDYGEGHIYCGHCDPAAAAKVADLYPQDKAALIAMAEEALRRVEQRGLPIEGKR